MWRPIDSMLKHLKEGTQLMHIYTQFVMSSQLISPVNGYTCRRITKQNIKQFGFDNNIDPSIIAHPANCQILPQPKNSSKNMKCDISIKELLERIDRWDKKYGGEYRIRIDLISEVQAR